MANDQTIPSRLRGTSDDTLLAQGKAVRAWDDIWREPPRDYPVVRSFAVYPPRDGGGKFLVVLKAYGEDGDLVAFYKADTLMGAIAKSVQRLLSRTTEWKPDTPYRDRRR